MLTSTDASYDISEVTAVGQTEADWRFTDLPAGQTREFNYRLRALLPVKTNTPPPVVDDYYSPEKVAVGNRTQFTARR